MCCKTALSRGSITFCNTRIQSDEFHCAPHTGTTKYPPGRHPKERDHSNLHHLPPLMAHRSRPDMGRPRLRNPRLRLRRRTRANRPHARPFQQTDGPGPPRLCHHSRTTARHPENRRPANHRPRPVELHRSPPPGRRRRPERQIRPERPLRRTLLLPPGPASGRRRPPGRLRRQRSTPRPRPVRRRNGPRHPHRLIPPI